MSRLQEQARHTENYCTSIATACSKIPWSIKGVPKSGTTWLKHMAMGLSAIECIKTHTMCVQLECISKHSMCFDTSHKYLSIYRDTRDVTVSDYHWAPGAVADVNDFALQDGRGGCRHIVSQQNKMLAAEDAFVGANGSSLRLFYEDMLANTTKAVRDVRGWDSNTPRPDQSCPSDPPDERFSPAATDRRFSRS